MIYGVQLPSINMSLASPAMQDLEGRQLFLAGVALGAVGGLLVESLGVVVDLVGQIAPRVPHGLRERGLIGALDHAGEVDARVREPFGEVGL